MGDKYQQFQTILRQSRNIICLTGAGTSAESGIPVFRGAGGFWRQYKSAEVATPQAFRRNPSLVWEFYHYRRGVAFSVQPNPAHYALAKYQELCAEENRTMTIITQNVDGLHQVAGSENVIELHGSLRRVQCTKCKHIEVNTDNPICEALRNRGDPNLMEDLPPIPIDLLPKCTKCNNLVRPHIVWFGEALDSDVMNKASELIKECDACLVIGTSSVVYPAAMFAPLVAERGHPVAEFNLNDIPASPNFRFHFSGPCGTTVPKALGIETVTTV